MTNQAWTYGVEDPGTCPETLFDWWHVRFSTASSTPISFQMGFIDVPTIASLFLFETNELFIDGSILMRARKRDEHLCILDRFGLDLYLIFWRQAYGLIDDITPTKVCRRCPSWGVWHQIQLPRSLKSLWNGCFPPITSSTFTVY